MKSFITKGILPLLLLGTITWLGQYIFIVDVRLTGSGLCWYTVFQ